MPSLYTAALWTRANNAGLRTVVCRLLCRNYLNKLLDIFIRRDQNDSKDGYNNDQPETSHNRQDGEFNYLMTCIVHEK